MSGILFPEIVIFNVLRTIIKLLKEDLVENQLDKKQSILYKLLGVDDEGKPIKMNNYEYFVQAEKIITRQENLSVNFGYNSKVAQSLALHIILPSEQGKSAIGSDEGYRDEDIIVNDVKTGTQSKYTQTFDSTYQIMITGNNASEVNIVYNILKSMLLMLTPQIELMGLMIPALSGNDIIMQEDLTPVPLFHKVINLSFTYEHTVPQIVKNAISSKFYFTIQALDYNDEAV